MKKLTLVLLLLFLTEKNFAQSSNDNIIDSALKLPFPYAYMSEAVVQKVAHQMNIEALTQGILIKPVANESLPNSVQKNPPRVFGFSEIEATRMSGDIIPDTEACSKKHIHDDLANRWCHAFISKVIKAGLVKNGFFGATVSETVAEIAAAAVFLPKEYIIDMHPSMADIAIVEHKLFHVQNEDGTEFYLNATIFFDGAFFLNLSKSF